MDSKIPSSTKAQAKWTREDIFQLLSSLNLHIGDIAPSNENPSDEEMKEVISSAAALLCTKMGSHSTESRIEKKLASLWSMLGDVNGDKKPYPLYQYGAFTKTLPGLEDTKLGFPGMLNEIAENVKMQQLSQGITTCSVPVNLRRSQRKGVRNDFLDPIVCRCGFTHHIACIHCDRCFSWQHQLCYYDTQIEEHLPDEHVCDECEGLSTVKINMFSLESDDAVLVRDFGQLCLSVDDSKDLPSKSKVSPLDISDDPVEKFRSLGPFAAPGDDAYFWGPADDHIQDTMEYIMFLARQVVHFTIRTGMSARRIKETITDRRAWDMISLIDRFHGPAYTELLLSLISKPLVSVMHIRRMLCGLLSASIIDSVFYPQPKKSPSVDALLYEMFCKNILRENGPLVLRDLRRKCLLSLFDKFGHTFANAIDQESEVLANRLTKILLSMTATSCADEHLHSSQPAHLWKTTIKRIFLACLKLKAKLALSERFYEFHMPQMGTKSSTDWMMDESAEKVASNKRVEVCLMPAVIEYEPKDIAKEDADLFILPTEEIFVRNVHEGNAKGNIVSPAIVVLGD